MADLTFTIDIDSKDAIDSANNLQKEIKTIFDKTAGKNLGKEFDQIKVKMNKAAIATRDLQRRMEELSTKEIGNTHQYQRVLDKIAQYNKQYELAKKNLANMPAGSAVYNDAYEVMKKNKAWLDIYQRLKTRMEQQGKDKIYGKDTEEYSRLAEKLGDCNNRMALLVSSAKELAKEGMKANDFSHRLGKGLDNVKKSVTKVIGAFKKIGTPIAKAVSGLTKLTSKMLGINKASDKHNMSLKKMINQVLRYGLGIRSLFILWRKLRTYTADALKLMATQFEEVDADVSALMNSFNQMKLSFGTMAQPLMHALAPALIYIIELITRAMTALANFFAILTGQKYIYKAQKANDSYADSIKGVGSAAKEANKELAEYDNLLVIDQPKDGSGGGGSGAADGLTGTFEKTLAESDFAKQLKDAINRGDWEGVGGLFATKLNVITKTFDNWINKKFRPKAVTWASRIGRILNGLTEGWDSNLTGKTVADTLNAILDTANTFFKTYKFKRLGEKVGGLIKGFFDNMDPVLLGETLANKINAVIDFATGLIDTTPWAEIGDKLGTALKTWFETVKWEDLGADLQKLASGILTSLAHFIQTSKLGTTVGTAINRFLSQIDFGQLAEDLSTCAISILDAIADLIVTIDWHRVGEAIADFLTHIDWLGLLAKLAEVALSLLGAFAEALSGLASNPKALLTLGGALLAIFGVKAIWNGLRGLFSTNIGSALSGGVSDLSTNGGFLNGLKSKFGKILGYAVTAAITYDTVGGAAGKLFAAVTKDDEELSAEYSKFGENPIKYTKEAFSTAVEAASEYSQTTGKTTLQNAWDAMWDLDNEDALDKAMDAEHKRAMSSIMMGAKTIREQRTGQTYTDDEWEQIYYGERLAEVKGNFETLRSTIESGGTNVLSMLGNVIDGIDETTEKIAGSSVSVKDSVAEVTDYIPPAVKEAMEKAQQNAAPVTDYLPEEVKTAVDKTDSAVYTMSSYIPPTVKEAMEQTADGIEEALEPVPGTVANVGTGAYMNLTAPFDATGELFAQRVTDINDAFAPLPNDLGATSASALQSVQTNFATDSLTGHFTSVKDNIETPFKELPSFFSDTFKQSWNEAESAFSSGNTTFNNFNAKLSEGMTNTINGLIGGLNSAVSGPLQRIQEVINKFKNVKIGASSLFSNLPSFSNIPSIPMLAQGAVIPPNREFLAMLGDQTSGTNIETPLETMVQAFKSALSEMGGSSNNQNIVLQLDGRTVAQCVWDEEDKRYKQTGRR